MARNIFSAQSPTSNAQQPQNGVWQDNPTHPNDRTASHQPAPQKKTMRPQEMKRNTPRSQKRSSPKRQTVHTTLHLKPRVRAELERVATLKNLSVSATGAALLEHALQQNLYLQHEALLEPLIAKAINKNMRGISTRLAWLLVRVAFDAGQTRSLVTNILGRQPGISDAELTAILDGSSKTAKGNITRKTPQLTELITAVEKWIMEEEGEKAHV